ncbi:MAG: hypothetical protein BWZ10_00886 [candidate division BRC1 bacterium ADurb.BinA364]|nr:MAG: hypothetical protein BWZ10_00886 [candidate division BRC1 bacterium ADurb.BinA364]
MNRLHPVYHSSTSHPGSRTDIERLLPILPSSVDAEELLDNLSEPPHFLERLAPVRTQVGDEIVRGKNWTDLMIKTYRAYGRMWSRLTLFIHPILRDNYNEPGMLPFMSVCIDPDTFHRILESDYEAGENTYGSLMQLFAKGVLSPCATIPFGMLLPMAREEFDKRMAIRLGLRFYKSILQLHYDFIRNVHHEKQFVLPFWLPEGAYCDSALAILVEEFDAFCKENKFESPHLVLLLDNVQAPERDNDVLMKSWNALRLDNGAKGRVSVIFRDKAFSEWVTYSSPSVKKLLDRTIAKVDSDLNAQNINYCWSHFEDLESLSYSPKSAVYFEQKILKLVELGYLPITPDVFIRRKLNGKFGRAKDEPHYIDIANMTSGADWGEEANSLARWTGLIGRNGNGNGNGKTPKPNHPQPYKRETRAGEVEESGSQCWKIAWNETRLDVLDFVRGDPKTLKGGALEVLASLVKSKNEAQIRRNVEAFLFDYSYVYWREHFIQHEFSEADLNIADIVKDTLYKGIRGRPKPDACALAAAAAQAYYFALDALRADDVKQANFDQRALYQNALMLTLALCNMIYVYRWQGDAKKEKAAYRMLKERLLHFEDGYQRCKLAQYGVREKEWNDAIASHIENCDLNCVARAARRAAARHLRPLGYRRDFPRSDENLTTHVGHIWTAEVANPNYRWENHLFCGTLEE